ncbi:hypothetical protein B0H67DRAFT_564695 [Lasiosphaeris hirsuta]|uniref:Uncharacterized protein n=1 Tax=Lasiosphaeris hirsuta TaxID=260670 RepID=A0AA40EDK2_9PEZI|nr:hypothetical protein B0H67DRAFT_564695 [Lasiosphaeris hirsuta]
MTGLEDQAMFGTVHTWTPGQSHNETRIHRRYVQVHRNQKALLDSEDSWKCGKARVPKEVLQEVVKACVKRKPATSRKSPVVLPPASTPRISPSHNGVEGVQAGKEENTVTQQIPWSSSPARNTQPPSLTDDGKSASQSPSRRSSVPRLRQTPSKPIPQAQRCPPFPPSSQVSDSGLEFEPPKAITDFAESGASIAAVLGALPLPGPTPPSAQIIPSTYADQPGSTRLSGPEPKRRRLMKNPRFSPVYAGSQGSQELTSSSVKPPVPSYWPYSSAPMSSLPARAQTGLSPGSELVASSVDKVLSLKPPSRAALTPAFQRGASEGEASSLERPPPNGPMSQVPYAAFKLFYTDYKGSVGDFVKGIICLQELQERRQLPEFLYDDFIRVFCGEYLEYIQTIDDHTTALTATQWYNENVSEPVYRNRLLTKENINNVLDKYPEELRAIRRSLGRRTTSHDSPLPSDTPISLEPPRTTPYSARKLPTATFLGNSFHADELASDPIETTGNTQPVRQTNPIVESSPFVKPITSRQSIRPAQTGVLGGHNPSPRQPQTQVEEPSPNTRKSSHRDTLTPLSSQKRDLKPSGLFPSLTLTQQSNPESVPETLVKPRVPPRFSSGTPTNETREGSNHPRNKARLPRNSSKRDMLWKEFASRHPLGSAPRRSTGE